MNKRRGSFGSGIAVTRKNKNTFSLIPIYTTEQMTANKPITVGDIYGREMTTFLGVQKKLKGVIK